jgi:ABC-2 type transport system ATP-binding protein
MIKAHALTRVYGNLEAIQDVSFAINRREIVALLGVNGAGKSTLMKMITGYLEPTSGEVQINGLNVWTDRLEVQQQIGYLPENCPLYPEMRVIEYLDYAADLRGVERGRKEEQLRFAVEKTNLNEVIGKPVSALSRGYRQRLGVAQALLNRPRVLIFDEPTNGLDPTQILEMRALIKELAENATVLISTHNLQEVQAVASRVIIIAKGKVALDQPLISLQITDYLEIVTDAALFDLEKCLQKLGALEIKEHLDEGLQKRYRISVATLTDGPESAASMTSALTERGFKVFGLNQVKGDLETIFAEITTGGASDLKTSTALTRPTGKEPTAESADSLSQDSPGHRRGSGGE